MALTVAVLAFVGVFSLVAGLWWAAGLRRRVGERIKPGAQASEPWSGILRTERHENGLTALLARTHLHAWLKRLVEQSGRQGSLSDVMMLIVAFLITGGLVGWIRLGGVEWALLLGLASGSLPVLYLLYRRQQRFRRFSEQFPEALEMMSRAIRAGHALAGCVQLVGDEMPDPVGQELKQVFEETRLGLDPGEALEKLWERVPTEDVRFFCTAIRIQRTSGGNLAETLDRLSEVIRERYKLLSQARVLSSQQRWSAILVGLSPAGLALILTLANPHYFDTALKSPYGPKMILLGLALEAIGFLIIWRMAKIKV